MSNAHEYVGSSTTVKRRLHTHRWALRAGRHENQRLQRSWDKYGEGAFVFEHVACALTEEDMLFLEQHLIDEARRAGRAFNMNLSVKSPRLGQRMPDVQKEALSKARKGVPLSPEKLARRRMLMAGLPNPMQGKTQSEATRALISQRARSGYADGTRVHPCTPASEATKEKLSAGARGNTWRLGKGKPVRGQKDGEVREWPTTIACAKDLGCDVSYPSQRVGTGKKVKGWLLEYLA